ncbi:MAG: hypothetical protein NT027_15205 [Proteobacteria bacterium]|nr:hypothetical protein [Pseudomonadota bacterium]
MNKIIFLVVSIGFLNFSFGCKSRTGTSKEKDLVVITDQGHQFLAKTRDNQFVCLRSCFNNDTPISASNPDQNTIESSSTCKTLGAQSVGEFSLPPDGFEKEDWKQFAGNVLDSQILVVTDRSKDTIRYVDAAVSRFSSSLASNCENYSAPGNSPMARSGLELSGNDSYKFAVSSLWRAPNNEFYFIHLYADFWNPNTNLWSGTKHWKITSINGKYTTLTTATNETIGGRSVNTGSTYIQSNYWCRNWFTQEEDRPGVSNNCANVGSDASKVEKGVAYFRLGGK